MFKIFPQPKYLIDFLPAQMRTQSLTNMLLSKTKKYVVKGLKSNLKQSLKRNKTEGHRKERGQI